jgi:hypothetical protein
MKIFKVFYLNLARVFYKSITFYFIWRTTAIKKSKRFQTSEVEKIVFIFPEKIKKQIEIKNMGSIFYELYQSCVDQKRFLDIEIIYYHENLHLNDQNLEIKSRSTLFVTLFNFDALLLKSHDSNKFLKKYLTKNYNYILYIDLDFVHPINQYMYARLHTKFNNSSLLAIDISPSKSLVRFMGCFGQRPLPYCYDTLSFMVKNLKNRSRKRSSAFIGTIYENREKLLKKIAHNGVNVIVNPQNEQIEVGKNFLASYENYLTYLSNYEVQFNFAKNSRESKYQLKSRIMELSIMGCKIVSDGTEMVPNFLINSELVESIDPIKTLKIRIEELMFRDLYSAQVELSKEAINFNNGFWDFIFAKISSKS